jgi:hypothetical protein
MAHIGTYSFLLMHAHPHRILEVAVVVVRWDLQAATAAPTIWTL